MDYVKLVQKAIDYAVSGISKLNKEALAVYGLSSTRGRHMLNNLCAFPEAVYLEIGSWKGATVIAASFANIGKFYAVDVFNVTFGQHDSAAAAFHRNKKTFAKYCDFTFFEEDSWTLDLTKIPEKVNVYFYDGDHTDEGTRKAFTYYHEVLADTFILVMDDWNYEITRSATKEALKNYTVLYDRELLTPGGLCDTQGVKGFGSMLGRKVDTWWNGMYVAVLQKKTQQTTEDAQ